MKLIRLIVAAFFIAVFLSFTVVCQTTAKARVRTQLLRGVVQYEVVEATEFADSFTRFFIQQCDGAPCDFAKLRKVEVETQTLSRVNIQNVYLEGTGIDFEALHGNEVILRGIRPSLSRKQVSDSPSNTFIVSSVEKVFEKTAEERKAIMQSQLFLPPLTLPTSPTTGQWPVLVIRVRHQAVTASPYSQSQIKDWIFTSATSARKYFEDQSTYIPGSRGFSIKGLNDITGDVTPEVTVTATATTANCAQYIGNEWRWDADNQAETLGYSKVAYPIRIYLYAAMPGCSSTASASGRNLGNSTSMSLVIMQLPSSGTQAALDAKSRVFTHEMNHAIGQGAHSKGQQTEGGPTIEEADPGDPLGQISLTFNHNVNFLKFGWHVNRFAFSSIQYQGTSTTVLSPPSKTLDGSRNKRGYAGAYIPLRDLSGNLTGEVFVLEAARPPTTIWDVFSSDSQAFSQGMAIRKIPTDFSSSLTGTIMQDTTPGTPCCKDAPLVPDASGSATWTSSLYNVTFIVFTPNSRGMMEVRVILGPNYPTAPSASGIQEAVGWVKRQ